jgi:serine phosphatase RsbU (regulator of sigma subunit)
VTKLDPTLERQIKRLGLTPEGAPDLGAWQRILSSVSDHYRHLADDRDLLNRSLELSTSEMSELRTQVEAQRDDMAEVVHVVARVLTDFGRLVEEDTGRSSGVAAVKDAFVRRIDELFQRPQAQLGDYSGSVSSIRGNLVQLADQLLRLLGETADRAAIKKELEVARTVQQLLIPSADVIDRPSTELASYFAPASACGGDWWTAGDTPDGRQVVVVGDVTGHGISSAIITGSAKAAFELASHVLGANLDAQSLMGLLNVAIHRTAHRQVMMTCSAATYDSPSRTLTFASAGHCFPILVRRALSHPIALEGSPLGATAAATYPTQALVMEPGDVVVWYTDGVSECENAQHEQFGERRLRAVCQRAAAGGARAARDAVIAAVEAFGSGTPMVDDQTLVVMSIR